MERVNYKSFSIDHLLNLIKSKDKTFNKKDLDKLKKIENELQTLNNMVGNNSLKKDIASLVIMLIQKLHDDEMMHTILMGPPGVGKTTIAEIIGNIFSKLGHLSKGTFYTAGREDLIGQFLGETAIKTTEVLEGSLGGVLFIDEVYSLGNEEKRDSFSKECIDTINKFLTEHPKDFLCIVAGYEEDIKRCFLNVNPGLDRRFPWKFRIEQYGISDLCKIFKNQIKETEWKLNQNIEEEQKLNSLFQENKELFQYNGGDTQNLLGCCKVAHSVRIFGKKRKLKKVFNMEDINDGFELFKSNKKRKVEEKHLSMYT